jgi:hypothetical protein
MTRAVTEMMVEIDIHIHKAIEANRTSFDETSKDILKRMLGIRSAQSQINPAQIEPRERLSRKRGLYSCVLFDKKLSGGSLKDLLKAAILLIESNQNGFIEKLAAHRTARGRRIAARKPEELYPGRPDLAAQCAERLDQRWWFDTNISLRQTQKYLDVISEIAGILPPLSITQ